MEDLKYKCVQCGDPCRHLWSICDNCAHKAQIEKDEYLNYLNNQSKQNIVNNKLKNSNSFLRLSWTWGIAMTLIGFVVSRPFAWYCANIRNISEKRGYCTYYKFGKGWGGFSLGPYCFISKTAGIKTMAHEHGHSLQNCLYGPFMLILSICSVVRYHYRNIKDASNKPCKTKYDDFWFEGQATRWGVALFNNALTVDKS